MSETPLKWASQTSSPKIGVTRLEIIEPHSRSALVNAVEKRQVNRRAARRHSRSALVSGAQKPPPEAFALHP